jgi:uncharacterized membrane-anchored protein
MMTKQTKFILAITLQVAIIFAIIIFKLYVSFSGTKVMLRIAPVDPRHLLRGDYIALQYDISNLNCYAYKERIKNGDTVYVVLRQSGKYWVAQNVQKTKPIEGELFIKGKVKSGGLESQTDQFSYQRSCNSSIHIVYGIEQYFIPEGKGRNFSFWNNELAALVAIDDNGNALLKKIYIGDKPWP